MPADPCPHCGDEHTGTCRPLLGTRMAEHVLEHPADVNLAALTLRVAQLAEELHNLAAEVHQRPWR